jgi:hypothetical protein
MSRTNGQLGLMMLPPPLDTSEFRQAWQDWLSDRVERRLPRYTAKAQTLQFERLAEMGAAGAIDAIKWSIAQAYKGIFSPPPQAQKRGSDQPKPLSIWEIKEQIKTCENALADIAYDVCGDNEVQINADRATRRTALRAKLKD